MNWTYTANSLLPIDKELIGLILIDIVKVIGYLGVIRAIINDVVENLSTHLFSMIRIAHSQSL